MPKIVNNGIVYSSTANIASNIKYNDENTQLGAYNVQTAIEKIKTFVKSLSLTAPKLVQSISQMTDKTTNYVLISTMEIYQWIEGNIMPTGIYYKTSDENTLLDFSQFDLEINYNNETSSIESIKQTNQDGEVNTTFIYNDNDNIETILENDGTNVMKTSLTYNEDGDVTDISRKLV